MLVLVGEGAVEVDITAILKSVLWWSTFSRLSESVVNRLLCSLNSRGDRVLISVTFLFKRLSSFMSGTRLKPLLNGTYIPAHVVLIDDERNVSYVAN